MMVIMLSVIVGTSLLTSVISQYYDSKLGTSTDLFTTDFFDKFYTANCSAYTYFAVRFFTPCKDLIISVKKKKGQPYIYVSKTNPYPTRNSLTWATESNLVTIYKTDPNGYPGYYYIGIYNDCSQQSDNASFQIQARESADEPSFSLFYTDIGLHSELSSNKTVDANSFILFSFCLSSCENVRLRLEDCVNKTRCPKDYILPELLVSRQDFLLPSVKDYSYRLASKSRREIWVNHSDPSGRNVRGFTQGMYYVAVFGKCVIKNGVQSNAVIGPCTTARQTTKFSLSVAKFEVPETNKYGECPEVSSAVLLPVPPSYRSILSGVPIVASASCAASGAQIYTYYTLKVPSPCRNLNIVLTRKTASSPNLVYLVIGQYPNLQPTLDTVGWASYDYGDQNITISAFDPYFEGGYICGQDGVSECSVYIGVTASCTNNATRVGYALTATLNPLGNNIFQVPQVNQFVSAKRANTYKFCVDSQSNITAQIKSHADPCTCPASYANHDVLISRTFPLATKADLTWRMAGGNTSGTVELSGADTYTKPGTYYMNVFANCASDADCGKAKCTCSPCSNLPVSPYTLYVGTTADFSNGVSATVTLASCSVKGVLSGLAGQCVEVCPWEIQTVRSYKSGFLSIGAQVGISIGCLIAAMLLLGCYFYTRFEAYSCCRPLPGEYQNHFAILRKDAGDIYEMADSKTVLLSETVGAPTTPPE